MSLPQGADDSQIDMSSPRLSSELQFCINNFMLPICIWMSQRQSQLHGTYVKTRFVTREMNMHVEPKEFIIHIEVCIIESTTKRGGNTNLYIKEHSMGGRKVQYWKRKKNPQEGNAHGDGESSILFPWELLDDEDKRVCLSTRVPIAEAVSQLCINRLAPVLTSKDTQGVQFGMQTTHYVILGGGHFILVTFKASCNALGPLLLENMATQKDKFRGLNISHTLFHFSFTITP
ncbi:uncharacterized protein [Notamacropus eugenii]|uniref:uncharacterized protein n=1 Tax=Notamacropus eugenii TaxID=9315 RepID=UPI003B67C6C8